MALRAGLLHDIGKAVDKDVEGTHTKVSVELVKKCAESEAAIQAISTHHEAWKAGVISKCLANGRKILSFWGNQLHNRKDDEY